MRSHDTMPWLPYSRETEEGSGEVGDSLVSGSPSRPALTHTTQFRTSPKPVLQLVLPEVPSGGRGTGLQSAADRPQSAETACTQTHPQPLPPSLPPSPSLPLPLSLSHSLSLPPSPSLSLSLPPSLSLSPTLPLSLSPSLSLTLSLPPSPAACDVVLQEHLRIRCQLWSWQTLDPINLTPNSRLHNDDIITKIYLQRHPLSNH